MMITKVNGVAKVSYTPKEILQLKKDGKLPILPREKVKVFLTKEELKKVNDWYVANNEPNVGEELHIVAVYVSYLYGIKEEVLGYDAEWQMYYPIFNLEKRRPLRIDEIELMLQ